MILPSQTKPLHVERLIFKDGTTMEGKDVFLFNGFLIVDDGEAPPTWYNVDSVSRLEGVTYTEPRQRISAF